MQKKDSLSFLDDSSQMFASQSVNPQLRALALFRPFIAHLHNYMCIAYL